MRDKDSREIAFFNIYTCLAQARDLCWRMSVRWTFNILLKAPKERHTPAQVEGLCLGDFPGKDRFK